MTESAGKRIKRYIDYPEGKPTCLINGLKHSLDECKVLRDFGYKYVKIKPNKDRGHDPVQGKKFNKQQENIAIINRALDEIFLH